MIRGRLCGFQQILALDQPVDQEAENSGALAC
jgi:hypothetical protein